MMTKEKKNRFRNFFCRLFRRVIKIDRFVLIRKGKDEKKKEETHVIFAKIITESMAFIFVFCAAC